MYISQNITYCSTFKKSNISDDRQQDLLLHGNRAVLFLSKMPHIPFEVTFLIQCHHERPDGSGFPLGLSAHLIDDLSAVFIIAHDLVNYIWTQDKNADFHAFVTYFTPEYQSGVFSKFIEKLNKSLKVSDRH